jgi:hypothetical protein
LSLALQPEASIAPPLLSMPDAPGVLYQRRKDNRSSAAAQDLGGMR